MKMFVGFPVVVPNHQSGEKRFANLHITLAYWDNVINVECNSIYRAIASSSVWRHLTDYKIFKRNDWRLDLFGPNNDIPVLKLPYYAENEGWRLMHKALIEGIHGNQPASTTFEPWNPHITVPLELAIKPPQNLISLPIHMWRGKNPPRPIVR